MIFGFSPTITTFQEQWLAGLCFHLFFIVPLSYSQCCRYGNKGESNVGEQSKDEHQFLGTKGQVFQRAREKDWKHPSMSLLLRARGGSSGMRKEQRRRGKEGGCAEIANDIEFSQVPKSRSPKLQDGREQQKNSQLEQDTYKWSRGIYIKEVRVGRYKKNKEITNEKRRKWIKESNWKKGKIQAER